jgi:cobalt-zinc-cadmium efflux system membrane fusion protein
MKALTKTRLVQKASLFFCLFCQFAFSAILFAQEHVHADGSVHKDHGAEPTAAAPKVAKGSSVAESKKYELALHYEGLKKGEMMKMKLYISDYETNRPLENVQMSITSPDIPKRKFEVKSLKKGVYEVSGIFPEYQNYTLTVQITNGPNGADLLALTGVWVIDEQAAEAAKTPTDTAQWWKNVWLVGGLCFGLGLLLMYLFIKIRSPKLFGLLLMTASLLPTSNAPEAIAQNSQQPQNEEASASKAAGTEFDVPKDTQFLFEMLTERRVQGSFAESVRLYGTVVPSSGGQAVVQSQQVGKIVAMSARVGQKVAKGQTLATVEQTLDASQQVSLQAERNNLIAELEAARKDNERLKKIADIAAKRDLNEAEARLQKAEENLKIFENIVKNGKSNARYFALTAPISGIVGTFSVAIGSTVNLGEILFTITNLQKVYVEAQAFGDNARQIKNAKQFVVESTAGTERSTSLRPLSDPQAVNVQNQSQRILFELDNPDGVFKIGEYVNVRAGISQDTQVLALPNAAISDLNGKPVVFTKKSPEKMEVHYVQTGRSNGEYTAILQGLPPNERVVVSGTYQLKMIYLNQ